MQTLSKYLANNGQIFCKNCLNIVKVEYWANILQIVFKHLKIEYWANVGQILGKYRQISRIIMQISGNMEQILIKYWANIEQIFGKYCASP